jgi:hypothetical protein
LQPRQQFSHDRPCQPNRGIDLVRCESLNALDQATRIRVLQRNYAFLISMAPLTRDVKSLSR